MRALLDRLPPESPLREQLCRAEAAEGRGRWDEARAGYDGVLHRLGPTASASAAATLVRRIARCLLEEPDFSAALDCIELASFISRAAGDDVGTAHATNLRAIVHHQRGDVATAEALCREARVQAQAAGSDALVAMLDQNLGIFASVRGDLDLARGHYEASLAGYRALGLERPQGPLLNNLGMLYTDVGDWRAAERSFAQAIGIARDAGDVPARFRTEANRVELYVSQRRYRKARQLCRRLVAIRRDAGTAEGGWVGEMHKHMGVVAREMGDDAAAGRHFDVAMRVARQREDLLLTAEIQRELAVLHQRRGRHQETLEALNRAHALFTQLSARHELTDVARRLGRLESQFLCIVRRWGSSIESKDRNTQGHCTRVADLACALARDAGMDERILLWLRMGALLHDVGKVTVPDAILTKTGPLTPSEQAVMRLHPITGEALLTGIDFPWDIRPMIRHHHERWDGTGYPDRLRGEEIPLAARLLTIVDVYDALTSARSYRPAFAPDDAVGLMRADSGTIFDPRLLDVFLSHTVRRVRHSGAMLRLSA